jgi:hypothetical protein
LSSPHKATATESAEFPFEVRQLLLGKGRINTESFSLSKATL